MGPVILTLWALIILHIVIIELLKIDLTIFNITAFLVLGCLMTVHIWFLYVYLKNHKKVQELQDQYVETLKPDKPLRFCPTDDELMKRHFENVNSVEQIKQQGSTKEEPQENTDDDSLELEMN